MRETDRIPREPANPAPEHFHRGPLGRVLERYLQSRSAQLRSNYSMVALEQLWARAAVHDPAIGLHLFGHFSRQDWHVLAHACLYSADLEEAIRFWARYAPLASDMDSIVRAAGDSTRSGKTDLEHSMEGVSRFAVEMEESLTVIERLVKDSEEIAKINDLNIVIERHLSEIASLKATIENNLKTYKQEKENELRTLREMLEKAHEETMSEAINRLKNNLEKENKNLTLVQIIDKEEIRIESNYFR